MRKLSKKQFDNLDVQNFKRSLSTIFIKYGHHDLANDVELSMPYHMLEHYVSLATELLESDNSMPMVRRINNALIELRLGV
jgi:pyruvate/oxaloacetate carboxyltransferase